jgi:YhcH/YjgK/YiaL family protein
MIIDQLENSGLYNRLGDRFAIALKYLVSTDLSKVEVGKYEIEGNEIFAIVSEYQTKSESDAKWEAHQVYADIQYIINGEERMGYAPLETMEINEAYNPDKDIIFLNGSGDYITATPGTFVVFFPHDAHQPAVSTGNGGTVKKVVVKVMV